MESPNNFDTTQFRVFEDEQKKKKIENAFAFILTNGALFRYFAQHLPKDLYKVWDDASGETENKNATEELGKHYDTFRSEIRTTLEAMDPEVVTGLTVAAENGEVDTAYNILHTYFELRDDAQEEAKVERAA